MSRHPVPLCGLVLAVTPALVACRSGANEPTVRSSPTSGLTLPDRPIPRTREAFLAELAPLPSSAILVIFDVEGPAGMAGQLELMVKPGGFRRETWSLEVPVPGSSSRRIEGVAVQTPDLAWTSAEGASGTRMPSPLGRLADRYVRLASDAQARAVETIRAWRKELRAVREESPGQTRDRLGVRCLVVRVGVQELCMWEAVGIPLEAKGQGFRLQARTITRDPELPPDAFVLPDRASSADEAPLPAELDLDPKQSLDALVAGKIGVLPLLLQPGLRLPVVESG